MSTLAIASIRLDGGTQSRARLNNETIAEYAEAIRTGARFPLPVVFYDGEEYWLADGFHRVKAFIAAERKRIECDVQQGDQRAAVLFSVGANATHGLPRSNKDKRRAVEMLLRDEEWARKSDRWVAEKCGVGHPFVGKIRSEALESDSNAPQATRETKDGREYPSERKQPERTTGPAEASSTARAVKADLADGRAEPPGSQELLVTKAALFETALLSPDGDALEGAELDESVEQEDEERWNADAALTEVNDTVRGLVASWPENESLWPLQVWLGQWLKTVQRLEERKRGAA